MSRRPTRLTRTVRLRVESLEDRAVPAVVTTLADNGVNNAPTPGSLRAAIVATNLDPADNAITFSGVSGTIQ